MVSVVLMAPQATAQEPSVAPEKVSAATSDLQAYLDRTASLSANFVSVLLNAKRETVATSEGEVFIKRPGKFRWEYRAPSPSIVLADGVYLWSYDEELEQAVKRKMSDYRGANPTMLLGGDANVSESFVVEGSYVSADSEHGEVSWLELIPRDSSSDFVKVRLGFREQVIYLMELSDRLEQTTRIEFSGVQTNLDLKDQMFVFVPPANVDLIGEDQ